MKLAEFQKVAAMLAKEHKTQILPGRAWAANIKDRKVYYRKDDIYNLAEEHILGLILHEIAHIHYSEMVPKEKTNPELSHTTLNMLEDISIEHIISKDYPNAGEILESTKQEVLDTLVKMLPKMNNVSMFEKSLLYASTRFEGRGYPFGIETFEKIGDKIVEIMFKRKDEIYGRKRTKDLIPLVREIVNLLIQELGQPTETEKKQMQQGEDGYEAAEDQKQDGAKQKVINELKAGRGWIGNDSTNNAVTYIDQIGDQAAKIGRELRSVLKRNNAMEFAGRYRSGKLIARRFIRTKILRDRKPFARRIVKSNQSYAFAVASDVSGSMFNGIPKNNNASYALSSMQMVGEALRIAGVQRTMMIFGKNAVIVGKMGKNQIRWDNMIQDKAFWHADDNGTKIDIAMKKCREELSKVRAERKIMIILTDGESDWQDMKEEYRKSVNQEIECLAIEITSRRDSELAEVFPSDKIINIEDSKNHQAIGKAFIDILKKSITKSI
jgi:predicted metal-dependent peptidase